jgi:CheY-like chemotaxis protein
LHATDRAVIVRPFRPERGTETKVRRRNAVVRRRDAAVCGTEFLGVVAAKPDGASEGVIVVADAPSILITDDDRDFRETLQGVFEPLGFHTFSAGDGEEALDILRRETVHLALLDMHMPRLTGLEALRQMKRFDSRLPCILLSAEADENLIAEAREAMAFDVLRKPVSRINVLTVVRLALTTHYEDLGPWRSMLGS